MKTMNGFSSDAMPARGGVKLEILREVRVNDYFKTT